MHTWGEGNFDWAALDKACLYVSDRCRQFGRFGVWTKEKYGTLRVETTCAFFGHWPIHNLIKPGFAYYQWPRWVMLYIDLPLGVVLRKLRIDRLVQRYQLAVLKFFWKRAAKKWPHISEEIMFDYWTINND